MIEPPPIASITEYSIGHQIGQGAYATVKSGIHKKTGQHVAIKIYEKHKLLDQHRKKSVLREISLLKRINSPHIIKLIDVIETSKQLFIITEYINGITLSSFIRKLKNCRLSENECAHIFSQVADGISYLHRLQITHRDIKMDNILVDPSKTVKIIDFGFSIFAPSDIKLKIFCGTPSYMSPEIVSRKQYYGPPSDVWSLGVLLYSMLCGTFPFKGLTDTELFDKIKKGVFSFPPFLSEKARRLISSLLHVDPNKRISSAKVLVRHRS